VNIFFNLKEAWSVAKGFFTTESMCLKKFGAFEASWLYFLSLPQIFAAKDTDSRGFLRSTLKERIRISDVTLRFKKEPSRS
jgi:hypothetical protein